jgi:TRAP-type C4-dicarboxylate transport system permease small subunit
VTVGNKRRWSRTAAYHLNTILFAFMGVYTYRDLLPLATFTHTPVDIAEGWLLWVKIVVIALVSIVIPLTIPRQYAPANGDVWSSSKPTL